MRILGMTAAAAVWIGIGGRAAAHTLVTPYDLPIPFTVYVSACAAALLLTFLVLALVPFEPVATQPGASRTINLGRVLPAIAQAIAVALLLLVIAAGLFGTPSPVANVAPTLFWIGMVLGLATLTAVVGDVFQIANPWRTLSRLLRVGAQPRLQYPSGLAYWPAFIFYLALAWLELMAPPRPSVLGSALLGYTVLTIAGAALYGRGAWFRQAELFSVLFRVTGMLAPLSYEHTSVAGRESWGVRQRSMLSGTLETTPHHLSILLFVLFMLAATTYDGVWQTSFWAELYWGNLMAWLQPLWGNDLARAQALLGPGYIIYRRGGLLAAPFVYLAVYWAVMVLMGGIMNWSVPTRTLALRFTFSIVPIALAYMLAHSWTLLLTAIPVIPFLLSDPFGIGWNLLGLTRLSADPPPLNMGHVWHIEVALILIGHVASVYLAHLTAQRTFTARHHVWLSELPLLVLMMGYTFIGLTVLSLPLALH